MTHRLHTLCLVGLMAALSKPASAQTAPRTGSLGGGGGSGPVMTRDELRACLKQQDELAKLRADYEARTAQLTKDREALLAEGQAVSGGLGDAQASMAKINEVNARATALAERVDEWNVRWQAFLKANRSGPVADRQRAQLVREQKAMDSEKAALDAEREQLGDAGQGSAAEVNERSAALNARTVEWNTRNKALVVEGENLAQERDLWASECGNRRYREEDEIAIKQGR